MSSPINSPNPPVTQRASSGSDSTKTSLIKLKDPVQHDISYFPGDSGGGGGTKDGVSSEGGTKEAPERADEPEKSGSTRTTTKTGAEVSRWQLIFRRYLRPIVALAKQKEGSEKSTKSYPCSDGSRHESSVHKVIELSPLKKVSNSLAQIKAALDQNGKLEKGYFTPKIEAYEGQIAKLREIPATEPDIKQRVDEKLDEINKGLRKLKFQIPSSSLTSSSRGAAGPHHETQLRSDETGGGDKNGVDLDKMLSLDKSEVFYKSSTHEEIKSIYQRLEKKQRKCLLCFALFAENEELKKRMLTYWWAGEEFLTMDKVDREKTIEDVAGEILNRFVADGLIEPVKKKRQSTTKAYMMRSVVRSAIITFAREEGEFSFNATGSLAAKFTGGSPTEPSEKEKEKATDHSNQPPSSSSSSNMVQAEKTKKTHNCIGNLAAKLIGANKAPVQTESVSRTPSKGSPTETKEKEKEKATDHSNKPPPPSSSNNAQADKTKSSPHPKEKDWDQEKLVTIFNVNEQFPDQRLKLLARVKEKDLSAEEFLLKMKNLRVLYLGTWRPSAKHHIELDSTEFLEGLKKMSSLRLLSLQGISRINELTDSIKGLTNLRILDLKACHNLEELPKEISCLRNLTHLDVSDCYLIDHMPKGLSSLVNLQVLKGFTVGDYPSQTAKFCTLENLSGMTKLRKLSLITSKMSFPSESEWKALENLQKLLKLTLSWGADSTQKKDTTEQSNGAKSTKASTTPWMLEKLDVQCYPKQTTPTWLNPDKLNNLKKLYIRGGKLGNENLGLPKEWKSVQTLRLKYLAAVKMDWEEMQRLFPGLIYLEKVDCPLITMCPCDEDGVWVKHAQE